MSHKVIRKKCIFYFRNPSFPAKPHYHIFLSNSTPYMISVCTSQEESQKAFLGTEREEYLLKIDNSVLKNSTKDTFVNCWQIKEIHQNDIDYLESNNGFEYSGEISNDDYSAILNLLLKSRAVSLDDKEFIRNELLEF